MIQDSWFICQILIFLNVCSEMQGWYTIEDGLKRLLWNNYKNKVWIESSLQLWLHFSLYDATSSTSTSPTASPEPQAAAAHTNQHGWCHQPMVSGPDIHLQSLLRVYCCPAFLWCWSQLLQTHCITNGNRTRVCQLAFEFFFPSTAQNWSMQL